MNDPRNDSQKNLRVNKTNFYVTTLVSLLGGYAGYAFTKMKPSHIQIAGTVGGFALTHFLMSKYYGTPFKLYTGNKDTSTKPH